MKKGFLYLLIALMLAMTIAVSAETPREMLPENARIVMYMRPENFDVMSAEGAEYVNENSLDVLNTEVIYADSLTEALMLLTSGHVDAFTMFLDSTRYLASRNEDMITFPGIPDVTLHMIATDENATLIAELDKALAELEADGTLSTLYQSHVEDVIAGADALPVTMPTIEGAPTYKVGVSGDLPPLDYTTADGTPAGYNTALLAALSERMNVNFELFTMEGGSRFLALESGKIDLFFWHNNTMYGQALSDDALIDFVKDLQSEGLDGFTISMPYHLTKIGWLMMAR